MSMLNPIGARDAAINLVLKALESGSIKLGGPTAGTSTENAGEKDALYLASLIKTLKEKISE